MLGIAERARTKRRAEATDARSQLLRLAWQAIKDESQIDLDELTEVMDFTDTSEEAFDALVADLRELLAKREVAKEAIALRKQGDKAAKVHEAALKVEKAAAEKRATASVAVIEIGCRMTGVMDAQLRCEAIERKLWDGLHPDYELRSRELAQTRQQVAIDVHGAEKALEIEQDKLTWLEKGVPGNLVGGMVDLINSLRGRGNEERLKEETVKASARLKILSGNLKNSQGQLRDLEEQIRGLRTADLTGFLV